MHHAALAMAIAIINPIVPENDRHALFGAYLIITLLYVVNEEDYYIASSFTFYSSPSQECIEIILHNDDCLEGLHSFSVNLNEQPLNISTSGVTDILIADANDGKCMGIM